jgi:uncharacterized protein YkwD
MHLILAAVRRRPRAAHVSSILAAGVLASVLAVGVGTAAPAQAAASTPATWYSLETYYLKLVNCTRTGGWVQANGTCVGYGTGRYSKYVAPLRLGQHLSDVARSWAKHLATVNACTHGDPGARLRAAGYHVSTWGENIGCGWGATSIQASILASHLAMQREKATNGGHWRNIKNPAFHLIGIGIWRYGSQIRVVNDFVS